MNYKCIIVKSITYAQKSLDLLKNKGITSYIVRQQFTEKYGCAWCVKVAPQHFYRSLEIMNAAQIKMTGDIYDI